MLGQYLRNALLLTSLLCEVVEPRHHVGSIAARQEDEPCEVVRAAWAAQIAANSSSVPVVDGQVAYDCLNSVPLNVDDAVKLIRSIQPFLVQQSTVSYLKDPPAGYPFPAFDIETAFETILSNIQNGVYRNEHEFQSDLYRTFNLAKDAHFRYFPDLLTAVITFRRGDLALVSVSLDGASIPDIYVLSDIQTYNENSSFTPSPVRFLNGSDAVDTLANLSLLGAHQDRDALYNNMFYSAAMKAAFGDWQGYYGGSGRYGYIWPGPSTDVTFENGTTVNYLTIAMITGDFSDITDGASFYAKYCTGTKPVTAVATPTTTGPTSTATATGNPEGNLTAPAPEGYPEPVVIASDQSAAGYYLPNSDIAVLSLLTFAPRVPREFQRAVEIFIERAKASGKTKLILDVSANRGGLIFLGHDTFRQLFPQIVPDNFHRVRWHELLSIATRQFSAAVTDDFDPLTSDNETMIDIWESYYNYRFDYNLTNQHFVSAEAKFALDTFNGDNFTQIHRWNLNDPLLTTNDTWGSGIEITGYGNRTNFTQPFAAEDLILMYDGYCASTCHLLSEFLRTQAGVRSVTFGGRPDLDQDGKIPIIQNYGGTKGANNRRFSSFNFAANLSLAIQGNDPNTTSGPVGPLSQQEIDLLELNKNTYAANRSTDNSMNVRDHILREHLEDGIPAQFLYDPTDCRLFYTPRSIVDPVEQWRQVAEAAWGSGGCVAGGLGGSSGNSLKRRVLTPEQRKRGLETGTVVSLPDKEPQRMERWMANYDIDICMSA